MTTYEYISGYLAMFDFSILKEMLIIALLLACIFVRITKIDPSMGFSVLIVPDSEALR